MCFSAEASFTVATVAGIAGVATASRVGTRPVRWLAGIPCFFAMQQAAEGVVWLHFNGGFQATRFSLTALYIYLFFALIFWPTYVPIAVRVSEQRPWKRNVTLAALIVGLCVSAYNVLSLATREILPTVVEQSIQYGEGDISQKLTYGLAAVLVLYMSSIKKMWMIGTLAVMAFIVSEYSFHMAFISVWCFFAAIISVGLFFILKDEGPHAGVIQPRE